MTQTIAFVGLGAMGSEMAETLVKKQMRVVGFDMRKEAVARLEAAGGTGAASAAEAAEGADVLALMVVNADQAEAVLFNAGALEALKPGATVAIGDPLGRSLGPVAVELSHNGQYHSPAIIAGSSRNLSKDGKSG